MLLYILLSVGRKTISRSGLEFLVLIFELIGSMNAEIERQTL